MGDSVGSNAYYVYKWQAEVMIGGELVKSYWHRNREAAFDELVKLVNASDAKDDTLIFNFKRRQFKENV